MDGLKHQHHWQNVSIGWKHCGSCDVWEYERKPLAQRDFDIEISEMDWLLKNELQWRTIFRTLMQYRDRLVKDNLSEVLPHIDLYIKELRGIRKK